MKVFQSLNLTTFFALALWGSTGLSRTSPVRQLLQENRLDEAAAICRQYEVLATQDTDNFLSCAWVYFRSERAVAAEKILQRIKRGGSLPEYQLLQVYAIVGRSQMTSAEISAMSDDQRRKYEEVLKAKYDEAQKKLEPLIMEFRGTAVGRAAQELNAEFYELKGQLDPAAFIYRGLITDDPKRGRAHWGLGRYYLARGDIRRAIVHLEETTRLWPRHVGCRFNLGVIYLGQGPSSYREAAQWLGDAFRLNKADPGVLEQIGVLFEKKDRIADALKYWQKALSVNPESTVAREKLNQHYGLLVDSLIEQKKYDEALSKIESADKVITAQNEYHKRRGIIYRNKGFYDKAVSELKAYLEVNPNDGQAQREIGVSYLNLKLLDSAMLAFSKAVSAEPSNGMNHAWMAFGYENRKDFNRALESWKKAVVLLKDPVELERASRKIARIEGKNAKKKKKKSHDVFREDMMEEEDAE